MRVVRVFRQRSAPVRTASSSAAIFFAILSACSGEGAVEDGRLEPRRKDTGAHADAEDPGDAAEAEDTGLVPPVPDAGFMDALVLPDAAPIADRDGDGIPDDEDPSPGVPDQLLFADTFETERTDWLFTSVSMRIDPGQSLLRVQLVEPLVREGWLGPRPQWSDVYIRGLVRVNRIGSSSAAGTGRVGLIGRALQVSPRRYVLCGIDLETREVFISEHNGGDPAGRTLGSAAIPVALGEWVLLRFEIRGSALACSALGQTVRAQSEHFISGSSGFRAFDASFDADWFEVYTR